jgi:hypothetical protein
MEIRQLVTETRKLRKRWRQTRSPGDKNKLNNRTQRLKRGILNWKSESINKYLLELTDDKTTDYSLWKVTKRMKRPRLHNLPIITRRRTWAKDNQQKAEAFTNYLEQTFQPCENQDEPQLLEQVGEEMVIALVTSKEVAKENKTNINPKEGPGYDLITGEILKKLPKKAIIKLTHLINAAFCLKHVPDTWKMAEVIMIPKQANLQMK